MPAPRLSIWSGTLALSAVYAALIGVTWAWFVRPRFTDWILALAISIAIVQASMIGAILAGISLRRGLAARRAARMAVFREAVDGIVADAATGGHPLQRAQALYRIRPAETLRQLAAAARDLRGEARERIEWTIRGLGATLEESRSPIPVASLGTASLLERALAAHELAPEANRLADDEIPRALESDNPEVVLAGLDLLAAWRRVLVVRGAIELTAHPDARIREAACAASPFIVPPAGIERVNEAIGRALDDPEPAVRAAAARAAGELRIGGLDGRLDALTADPDARVSLAAAFALATLPDGVPLLARRSTGAARTAAAHAFEALEKRNLGRLEAL